MISTNQRTNTTIFLFFFIFISYQLSSISYAADFAGSLKGVTVTDSAVANTPPTALINYGKNGDIFNFDASGSTDSDGSIAQYKWDFGDGTTGSGVTVSHQFAASGNFPVTLTVVDNGGGIAVKQVPINSAPTFKLAVNFQPASAIVPSGFVVDSGSKFDAGRGYGWTIVDLSGARDRDNSASPDQSYDTLLQVNPRAKWSAAVPNGTYTVTVCVGDPSYPNQTQAVQIGGLPIIGPEQLTSSKLWIEQSTKVTVVDGQLTLTFLGSNMFSKLCWITITN